MSASQSVTGPHDPSSPVPGAEALTDSELRARRAQLTPEQFSVVCENGTEPAFHNAYWDHHEPGLYVDVISGKPLFSSTDKFNSGTGWPSFTRPVDSGEVITHEDASFGMTRTEVRSRSGNGHLGHVFDDGPLPTGQRYCINSASLRFVPVDHLEAEGYGAYRHLFGLADAAEAATLTETAVLGAGCFWGVEAYFKRLTGVVGTTVGYAGGKTVNPSYHDVCAGGTGHAEVVRVVFHPDVISFETILRHFWRLHDPTSRNRQGNDVGTQYRSLIITQSPEQERVARAAIRAAASRFTRPIVTEVASIGPFYPAEDDHQDYLGRNPGGYCHINLGLADKPLD